MEVLGIRIPTIEEIDALIEQSADKAMLTAEAEAQRFNLCQIYRTGGRAILSFALPLLWFKPSWQKIVKSLIVIMDEICE